MTVSPRRAPDPDIQRRPHFPPAWVVTAVWRDEPVRREFQDDVFGGSQEAFNAAWRWREAQPWYTPASTLHAWRGVDEVRRYETQLPGNTHVSAFWYFNWIDEAGQKWARKFSVAYWGEEGARQRAQAVREELRRRSQAGRIVRTINKEIEGIGTSRGSTRA